MVFLGVDAGGTKTEAILVDETCSVLSLVKGGPANHESVGVEGMLEELDRILDELTGKAGLKREDITFAFFGMAGVDHEEDYTNLGSALKKLGLKRFSLDNDGRVALRSGNWKGTGIMVNCGTGSVSYAFDGERLNRIGGFSWTFGERLGTYYIAGMVISAVVRAKDGRAESTSLVEMVEDSIGMDVERLRLKARFGIRELSSYVPTIVHKLFEAYESHDYVATKIIIDIVEEVLRLVRAHRSRLRFAVPIHVILVGSFFKNSPPFLREMIGSALGEDYNVSVPAHNPVVGSALMAMEEYGLEITPDIFENLVKSYMDKRGEDL